MTPGTGKTIVAAAPPGFDFRRCVEGHGWFDLAPFVWDQAGETLARGVDLPGGGAATIRMRPARRPGGAAVAVSVAAEGAGRRAGAATAALEAAARRMLRLDEDLGGFYEAARSVAKPDLRWAGAAGAGRLLRAPTVFEDLVRMICTTNCGWSLTRVMVANLVEALGRPAPAGHRTFPSAEAMAAAPPRFYRDRMRAGYRAGALRALARDVAAGDLDPESWDDPGRPTDEIRRAILAVRGAGPYVADNMLKLLGRYDGLGLDSWCRGRFARLHRGGRPASDRAIARFYEPFGLYRGLALWCDLTRDWFEDVNPLVLSRAARPARRARERKPAGAKARAVVT